MNEIFIACICFIALGGFLGILLSVAAKVLIVKQDKRIDRIADILPNANCGGCGYAGCGNYAKAIVESGEKCNLCGVGGKEAAEKISEIMGIKVEHSERYRAQVMCSGTVSHAKKKYILEGIDDCVTAEKLAGGDKMCPNGCIGLGTCTKACPFGAISLQNGVAYVDYDKCRACGACVVACPKGIIKLIPFDAQYWVGCMCVEKGAKTRTYCEVGCISCKLCEKNCPTGAITVDNFVAHIDYDKCIHCGKCESACPRKIIWSKTAQNINPTIEKEAEDEKTPETKSE